MHRVGLLRIERDALPFDSKEYKAVDRKIERIKDSKATWFGKTQLKAVVKRDCYLLKIKNDTKRGYFWTNCFVKDLDSAFGDYIRNGKVLEMYLITNKINMKNWNR